jgi:hypothetical protein
VAAVLDEVVSDRFVLTRKPIAALRCPALPHRVPERDRTPVSRRFGQDQEDLRAAIVCAVVRPAAALAVLVPAAVEADSPDDGVDPSCGLRGAPLPARSAAPAGIRDPDPGWLLSIRAQTTASASSSVSISRGMR